MSDHARNIFMSARQAMDLVPDGATVTTSGFCGSCVPEELFLHLGQRFGETGHPHGLTLTYCGGQGDFATRGLTYLAQEGLVTRIISGYMGTAPQMAELVLANKAQAYCFPLGVISQMYRDIAARKPRTITRVGLDTFVDPRRQAGRQNDISTESWVELMELDGQEYLAYKTFPIHVAILRGTSADEAGNISMEREALTLEVQAQAMAAKASGGLVVVQVERLARRGTLDPRLVKVPGVLVDAVVVADPALHRQTYIEAYNPAFCGETRVPLATLKPMPMSERKIICRRAALELPVGRLINLGIGMPEGLANIANEEGILDRLTLSAEPGVIGGMPASGLSFGAATNPEAIIDQPAQFDLYHGGGLAAAVLGLAQADERGNLNVSKFGPKLYGPGGFIDISQNSRQLAFVGTFTAGGLQVAVEDGQLRILREGRLKKFVKAVEQVTFSGGYAARIGQPVLYITERCVFRLTPQGLELIEIAPGISVERDILPHMEFAPLIPREPRPMDGRLFREQPMGLADQI